MVEPINIFTDGSCLVNPGGPGGYAAIILRPGEEPVEISGGDPSTTNNRMEMVAIIEGLKAAGQHRKIIVHSDSKYVINGFKAGCVKGWKRRGWKKAGGGQVKNVDLWMELDNLCSKVNVAWIWVKGHNGHEFNELADNLAGEAARNFIKEKQNGEDLTVVKL